jgi:hypothetical protein
MDQAFEVTTLDARVVTWMQSKIVPYQKASLSNVALPVAAGILVLLTGALSTPSGEKEYSQLETAKIQAACGLINTVGYGHSQALHLDAGGRQNHGTGESSPGRYLPTRHPLFFVDHVLGNDGGYGKGH